MPQATQDPLHGQVAIITGAGRGIGAAIAGRLAEMGAVAVLCRLPQVTEVQRRIRKSGGKAQVAQCDLRDLRSVESVAERVRRDLGRADILVNNAGIGSFSAPLHQTPPEAWEDVLNTNLRGVYYCIRSFAPIMISARSGHIVNISSLAGKNPLPTVPPMPLLNGD